MSKELAQSDARERLAVLQRADALETLLKTPGWRLVCDFFEGELARLHAHLQRVDTGTLDVAIATLQRWQIAQKFMSDLDTYIETVLAEAKDIRGGVTLDEALLMEQVHEHERAGDPGQSDPTGY